MSRISFLFVGLLIAMAAYAQITIGPGDFPVAGTLMTSHEVDNVPVNIGSPGANQTYSVATQGNWVVRLSYMVDPATTPYAALFPTSTFCQFHDDAWDEYEFFRVANNGLYLVGSVVESDQDTSITIPQPEVMMATLPCTYGSNWSSVLRFSVELYPGMVYTMTDSTATTVDGWGTMTSEFGSWPVLRFNEHTFLIADTNGHVIDSQEQWQYSYRSQSAFQGVEISGGTEPNFTQGSIGVGTLSPMAAEPTRGPVADRLAIGQNYPNPFNPTTILPVELQHAGELTVSIYDETGRVVQTLKAQLSAGSHELPIDGSQWATGTYFAQVRQGAQTLVQRMQLIK